MGEESRFPLSNSYDIDTEEAQIVNNNGLSKIVNRYEQRPNAPKYKHEMSATESPFESSNVERSSLNQDDSTSVRRIRQFHCELDGKGFDVYTGYVLHVRAHSWEDSYECKQHACGKSFATHTELEVHLHDHDQDLYPQNAGNPNPATDMQNKDAFPPEPLMLELGLEEDIEAELEEFIVLSRLEIIPEAMAMATDVLWRHIRLFPVLAELVGFFIEHQRSTEIALLQDELIKQHVSFAQQDESNFFDFVLNLSTTNPNLLLPHLTRHKASSILYPSKGWNIGRAMTSYFAQFESTAQVCPPCYIVFFTDLLRYKSTRST